ncbi:hypothetical protein [Litorimonas sp. WD9-15]|uniref:hypothetical protein n=1 Tax=Litorimonas sp. WD9-15 TaxID=3418716 RepID=UPI003D0878B8
MTNEDKSVEKSMGWLRWFLMAVAISGIAIFTLIFVSSFADRDDIQKVAVFAIQSKVQAEVSTHHPNIQTDNFIEGAERLRGKFGDRGKAFQAALGAKVDIAVAEAISRYFECETVTPERQSAVTGFFKNKNATALKISEKLESFIKGKYDATVSGLIRDIRIFSGVNILAFALILLLAWVRPGARFHLSLPAGLLLISAIVTICLYIFGQNWFYTLLLGNFWGFSYMIYMGVIFALTLDITLNHGRITTTILNEISNISIFPC